MMDDRCVHHEVLRADTHEQTVVVMQRLLYTCVKLLRPRICPVANVKVFNTNLYPMAFVGLFSQALAIRCFQNSYQYVMHSITSLQRSIDGPLCVGAVRDRAESARYFPDLSPRDLLR
jgi:hypothetical protein